MELEFESVGQVFEERGKPEYPKKNLAEQLERTNNILNPHMEWTPRPDLNPSYMYSSCGRLALSPLRHYLYSRPSFPAEKGTSSIQLFQQNLESHTEGPTNWH